MLCIRKKGFLLQSNPLKRGSDKRENITTSHPFHLGRFNCSHYGFFSEHERTLGIMTGVVSR